MSLDSSATSMIPTRSFGCAVSRTWKAGLRRSQTFMMGRFGPSTATTPMRRWSTRTTFCFSERLQERGFGTGSGLPMAPLPNRAG